MCLEIWSFFYGLLEFVAARREAAVQEYIFAKWIAKGEPKEFGRSDFIQALSRNGFLGWCWDSGGCLRRLLEA